MFSGVSLWDAHLCSQFWDLTASPQAKWNFWRGNRSSLQDDETGLPTERLDPTALAWIAERASPEVAARVATASEAAKYLSPETKFELQKNSSSYL